MPKNSSVSKFREGQSDTNAVPMGTTDSVLCFHKPVAACTVTPWESDAADNYDMACLDAIGEGQAWGMEVLVRGAQQLWLG